MQFNSTSSISSQSISKDSSSNPILSVRNLITKLSIKGQPVKVVDRLSFDLYPGKTLALVGESGSGKTMAALSIMRILPALIALPSEGEILYQDRNILTLSEAEMRTLRGAKIAMIFQDPTTALNPVYTIGTQLLEVVQLHLNLYGDMAENRILKTLNEVGISEPKERLLQYPHQLSGGMKQRIMIAMALLCEPDILIADEPTTALDVTIQAQILELIRSLQQNRGMALLLITHDMGVVAEMADAVIVMYATQGVESGPVLEVFNKTGHPYTQGLFASRPAAQTHRGKLKPIKGTVPPITNLPTGCLFHPRCPYVMPICHHGEVPNFTLQNPQHKAKCWLHDGSIRL